MKTLCIILGLFLLPSSVLSADTFVTRRDAYLLIWQSIHRPAFETAQSYDDVAEEDRGYRELSFGKRRGILADADNFRPNDPAILGDVLLWMYRTRNIRELPDMQEEDLPSMMRDFPIVQSRPLDGRISRADILTFMTSLDDMLRKEVHEVSFYADDFHGNGTAFGDTFDMHAITAAHRSFPSNTLVNVTNVDNGKNVVVRINDRGPYVDGRDMDLSKAAFEAIAPVGQGVLNATFHRLGHMDLVDKCDNKQNHYQRRITRDVHFFRGIPHRFTLGDQLVLQSNRPFVIQNITFPDGQHLRIQDFILPKEKYRIQPGVTGTFLFTVGDTLGRYRQLRMEVHGCNSISSIQQAQNLL